jgi:hypothetical protein
VYEVAGRICHEIADTLSFSYSQLRSKIMANNSDINLRLFSAAVNKLTADGFIYKKHAEASVDRLTASGQAFIANGGYQKKIARDEMVYQRQIDQIDSVINTNKSVIKTNNIIRLLTSVSAFAAVVSAIAAVFTFIVII